MSLYTPEDNILFEQNYERIVSEAKKKERELIGPSQQEINQIQDTILTYIINHKRILYGGFSLNIFL